MNLLGAITGYCSISSPGIRFKSHHFLKAKDHTVHKENGEKKYRIGEESLETRIRRRLSETTEWYKKPSEQETEDDENFNVINSKLPR